MFHLAHSFLPYLFSTSARLPASQIFWMLDDGQPFVVEREDVDHAFGSTHAIDVIGNGAFLQALLLSTNTHNMGYENRGVPHPSQPPGCVPFEDFSTTGVACAQWLGHLPHVVVMNKSSMQSVLRTCNI
jgi:hypothetical protein